MWYPPHTPPPHHPFIPRRRKQACYNLFSWLSMKVRGRATRASVRLDLLPLTPTVYLLSAVSPALLFFSAYLSLSISCPSSFALLLPAVTLHHHSCIEFAHRVSFLTPPVVAFQMEFSCVFLSLLRFSMPVDVESCQSFNHVTEISQ